MTDRDRTDPLQTLIDEVMAEPIPVYVPDDIDTAIAAVMDEDPFADTSRPFSERSHYVRKSTYYSLTVVFETVDEASAYRRNHDMSDVEIKPIELTYHQAQNLGLIR